MSLFVTRPSLALLAVALVAVACGSADQTPLGGPQGGSTNTNVPAGWSIPSGARATGNGSSSGGTDDAGTPVAAGGCTAAAAPATTPTFTQIYTNYFAPGAVADCATGNGCHTEFATAAGAWSFLLTNNQVGTSPPELTDPNLSWLSWYGGLMPASGTPCDAQAVSDLNAWAAAGAKDD